ncbi:unnamed protein product [Leptosia nina]|uniref:Odorant receptor n=1 Tax=Leptosia nina TaxID=320188 RepID=A0AAV1JQM0_9NEOP
MELNSDLYLNRAKLVMSVLGVWVPEINEIITRRLYKIFMLSLQYSFLLFQIINVFQVLGDMEAISHAVYLLFTQASLCCKISVFHWNIDGVRNLLEQMNSKTFQPLCTEHERILKTRAVSIKRLLMVFIVVAEATCVVWGLIPLLDPEVKKFPFDMWLPVNPNISIEYQIGFTYQEITICTSAFLYYGVDTVAISMIIFACAQMEIIMEKILSVRIESGLVNFINTVIYVALMASQMYLCCWSSHELTVNCEKLQTTLYLSIWYEQDLKFQRSLYLSMMRISSPVVLRAGHYISLSRETFVSYSFLFFQIVYVIQVWGDIDAVSRAVYLLFTQASLCFKISVFHWNIGLVRKLLEQMCCETFQPLSDFHERILKARAKYIKRLLLMFIIAAETTCLTWGLNPLFDSGARKFPFDMWMPISPEKDSFYAIGFLYQEITICMSALLYYGVDSVAISMVIFACAQLEIIMEKILSIQSYRPSVDDMTVEEYYTNANNKLIECVKHYHAVVRFTKLIEDTFHVYIFFQLTGAVGIIVMSAYRILILESQSIELIATMMYLTGMASQIYISCWSGHELTYLLLCCTIVINLYVHQMQFLRMPVDPTKSPHYEVGYVYQVLSIYISALLFFAVDSTTLCMIMFGCAELEIIVDKIHKIRSIPMSSGLKKSESNERILENNELFNECIRHHQAVVKFIELLEDTYHANIFFQLSGSVGIICIIGLRIVIAEPSSVQFYSMLNYMVTMLSQLFLYCWCGNELTTMSQNLREHLYLCPWYEQNNKFRRSLIIVMERMKRPIIFKAGHYIPLSRPTFVSIKMAAAEVKIIMAVDEFDIYYNALTALMIQINIKAEIVYTVQDKGRCSD